MLMTVPCSKFVTDERTNGRTDKRTGEGTRREHYAPSQSVRTSYIKTVLCSLFAAADGIAFMCFYDAGRVLSAIAKFLVHLLGKGRR